MARIIFNENVLEKAQERVRIAFDDFPCIVCTFSGGKDSLVTLHLVISEAEKRGRKVRCVFLDQEAEWSATICEVKRWMSHPTVEPYWGRMPFLLENSTSVLTDEGHYLLTYDPDKEDEWIHPYDPLAMTEYPDYIIEDMFSRLKPARHGYGMMLFNGKPYPDFYLGLTALVNTACDHQNVAVFGGMRANEALGRVQMCTHKLYKNINGTYTHRDSKGKLDGFHFNPIYDWKGSDVWKYIYDNKLPYNSLYDKLYQIGVSHRKMRVSSVCHEMALSSISIFAEIEPETWGRVQRRLSGTNTFFQAKAAYTAPTKFPAMFKNWMDYRDYLFETLVPEEKKPILAKVLAKLNKFMGTDKEVDAIRVQIGSILICDMVGVHVERFAGQHSIYKGFKNAKQKGIDDIEFAKNSGLAVVDETEAKVG